MSASWSTPTKESRERTLSGMSSHATKEEYHELRRWIRRSSAVCKPREFQEARRRRGRHLQGVRRAEGRRMLGRRRPGGRSDIIPDGCQTEGGRDGRLLLDHLAIAGGA